MYRSVLIFLVFILLGYVAVVGQHKVRDNKVWALKLNIKYCGFIPIASRSAIWNYKKGVAGTLTPINTNQSIYQWSWKKDPNVEAKYYRTIDIIAEMAAEKIYILQILVRVVGTGTSTKDDVFISLNYWISPLGLNTIPISPPPLRQFIDGNFDADDQQLFTNWFVKQHKYTNNNIWKDVNRISNKFDGGSTININIGNGTCIEM